MAIIKCPECGHQISEKATVCPSCGVEIAGKITKCIHCGEVYFKDDGLCPNCYMPYQSHDAGHTPPVEEQESTSVEEEPISSTQEEHCDMDNNGETTQQVTDDKVEISVAEDGHEDKKPDTISSDNTEELSDNDKPESEETQTVLQEEEEENQSEKAEEDAEDTDTNDDEENDNSYIDTDGEDLEKPVHIADENENGDSNKHSYIPVVVSLAITALIAAVCFYFYNDSKQSRETQAFELAMKSDDVNELKAFLRNFNDATSEHKKAVNEKITNIIKEREDLSLSLVTREKTKLVQYLADYPDTPQKQQILSMIDSIDWEDAQKTNTKAAYDKYIAEHANGLFVKEAKDKVTVKITAASAEDNAMAKSLYREFFLSVNGNDATRLSATINPQLSNFMGTENASNGDVTGWMKRQHGDDVSSVIWKLNHDYKITKKEQNGKMEYIIDFTAKQTIVKKDGRASSENYKISSNVNENKKITSMKMEKYTPQPGDPKPVVTTPTTPSKPSSSTTQSKPSSSTTPSKPSYTASQSKPSSSTTQSKPNNNTQSKPSSTATQSKPSSNATQTKPSSTATQSKPNNNTQSKPSGNATQSKPSNTANQSKPNNSAQTKPNTPK